MVSAYKSTIVMPGRSILVVDDEPEIRELLTIILESCGHRVVSAQNGFDALKVMADTDVEVVLTDLLMPERDGLEFITDLRKKYPQVRIVAMSGGGHIGQEAYLRIAKGFGAHFLLEKPFDQAHILSAIEAACAAPG